MSNGLQPRVFLRLLSIGAGCVSVRIPFVGWLGLDCTSQFIYFVGRGRARALVRWATEIAAKRYVFLEGEALPRLGRRQCALVVIRPDGSSRNVEWSLSDEEWSLTPNADFYARYLLPALAALRSDMAGRELERLSWLRAKLTAYEPEPE